MQEFCEMTAAALHDAMCAGMLKSEELVRYYLSRIEKYDQAAGLNAIAELDPTALEQARILDAEGNRSLPFFGLPVLLKDNIDVAGLHTTAGSFALADNLAVQDAPITANLRKNGAIILGKTNMTEFANYTTQNMPNGFSSRGGQVHHAYCRSYDPGGSSSGSAVAMSAGFCAAAVGTDTSFSVIACAAQNGITGLKPAFGSLPNRGILPISHTLDSAGAMTRDMNDALLLYNAMRSTPIKPILPTPPQALRIGINTFGYDTVSEAQRERYTALLISLETAGAAIEKVSHPYIPQLKEIMRCEFAHDLGVYLSGTQAKCHTLAQIVAAYETEPSHMPYGITCLHDALSNASGNLDDAAYLEAMALREKLREDFFTKFLEYDAFVMTGPTTFMHFIGLPSCTLRMCMADDGIPRGVILYGADERRLFAAALTMEKYTLPVTPPKF